MQKPQLNNPQPRLNTKGFGLAGVLLVILVLIAAGGAGVYAYHRSHKGKTAVSTTTGSTSTTTTTKPTTTPADPYAGWRTYTDTAYHYSFRYPADWTLTSTTATKAGDAGGAYILDPDKTVQVTYSNVSAHGGSVGTFTPLYVNKLSSTSQDLTVVGGYSPASGLIGNFLPSYHVVDSSLLGTYPLTIGTSSQFPSNPGFADQGSAGEAGAFESKTAVTINTVADAQAWLNSADAKTSLLILESLTYQQ